MNLVSNLRPNLARLTKIISTNQKVIYRELTNKSSVSKSVSTVQKTITRGVAISRLHTHELEVAEGRTVAYQGSLQKHVLLEN